MLATWRRRLLGTRWRLGYCLSFPDGKMALGHEARLSLASAVQGGGRGRGGGPCPWMIACKPNPNTQIHPGLASGQPPASPREGPLLLRSTPGGRAPPWENLCSRHPSAPLSGFQLGGRFSSVCVTLTHFGSSAVGTCVHHAGKTTTTP